MNQKITFRSFQLGEEQSIVRLLIEGFNGWPRFDVSCTSLEHWRWKYLENPLGNSVVQVALCEDKVVGARHSYPIWIRIAGKRFYGFCSGDIVVHPDYRGMGISTNLVEMNMKGMKDRGFMYAYYVSSNPIMIKRFEKQGRPRFPHPILNLVLIYDIDMQLEAMPMDNAWIQKYGYKGAKMLSKARELVRGPISEATNVGVYQINEFDSRFNGFFQNIHDYYGYIVERSIEYMNWRFCDSRAGSFVIHVAESNDGVLGYCVTRVNRYREDYPIGVIVELLALHGSHDVVHSLIRDALSFFDGECVNIVTTQVVQGHPYEALFKDHGFVDSRTQMYLYSHPYHIMDDFKKIYEMRPDQTYYSYGDIDSLPSELPVQR